MQREIANDVLVSVFQCSGELENVVRKLKENCSENELEKYRLGVGKVMAEMYDQIMKPIFDEHPDLTPDGFKV